jgi:hypothetical protein
MKPFQKRPQSQSQKQNRAETEQIPLTRAKSPAKGLAGDDKPLDLPMSGQLGQQGFHVHVINRHQQQNNTRVSREA